MACSLFLSIVLASASGSLAFQWLSFDVTPGSPVYACGGQDVSLPWKYQTEAAEHVIDTEWRFMGKDQVETVIATYVTNQFLPEPRRAQRMTFLANAGIRLSGLTSHDEGQYVVYVNVNLHGSVVTHSLNVTVTVTDPPVLLHNKLHVHLLPGVAYEQGTGGWHAQLSCGLFTSLGNPPTHVVFTTPTNQTLSGASFAGGNFTVLMANPVESGVYTCQLAEGPSTSCLKTGSTSLDQDYTHVDGIKVQLDVTTANLAIVRSQLQQERPSDCSDVQAYSNASGVHTVYFNHTYFDVYCDQETDGGGWTVFQRRQDGTVNFTRLYQEFEDGFGDVNGEFWLGLKHIHQLTSQGEYVLRVDMEDWDGNSTYALYNNFSIADGSDKYRLHLGPLVTGPSASSHHMSYNNGQQFSALGSDNSGKNCVATRRGTGWWFGRCTYVNPNGLYLRGYEPLTLGIFESKLIWYSFRGGHYSLKRIEMKIRKHNR